MDRTICALVAAALICIMGWGAKVLGQDGLPFTIDSPPGSVLFGQSVASGGDANRDGCDDLFIMDPLYEEGGVIVGRWFLYSGKDQHLMWSGQGSANEPNGAFGAMCAAFVGDIDRDGGDDVLLGRPSVATDSGAVDVRSGRTGAVLASFRGAQTGQRLGRDVAGVGDVNRDGISDYAYVERYAADTEGLVVVRSGADHSIIHQLIQAYPRRLRGAGDVNGDGNDDLIVGTWAYGEAQGALVYSGRDGSVLWQLRPSDGDSTDFGYQVAGGHDVNGDLIPDFVVYQQLRRGLVLVYSGTTGEIISSIVPSQYDQIWTFMGWADLNGAGDYEIVIDSSYTLDGYVPVSGNLFHRHRHFGLSIGVNWWGNEQGVGDLNGDGADDLILGGQKWIGNQTKVHVTAGREHLLLHGPQWATACTPEEFVIRADTPNRMITVLASQTGYDCTFIARLGICLDLSRPFADVARVLTGPDGVATFEAQTPCTWSVPRPWEHPPRYWLQAIDPDHPVWGPWTSNVIEVPIY